MSLQGLGTENSPLLVHSWNELKEAFKKEDNGSELSTNNYQYISLENDIDMTTETKGWLNESVQITLHSYIKFLGNNHVIRSLAMADANLFYSSDAVSDIYFDSLGIENFYILGQHSASGILSSNTGSANKRIYFNNCSFSGVLDGLHYYAGLITPTNGGSRANYVYMNNCVFNLYLKDKATFYGHINAPAMCIIFMTNCNIYLQGQPYVDKYGIFYTTGDLTTCQIRGNLNPIGQSVGIATNYLITLDSQTGAYNVIDLITDSKYEIHTRESSTIVNTHNAPNLSITPAFSKCLFDFTDPAGDGSMTLEDKLTSLNFLYGA